MKTKLRFKTLGWIVALLLGIFISSCSKEVSMDTSESDLTLKSGHVPVEQVCDLMAGKTFISGQVIYFNDGTNLKVTYLTTNGWTLSEVHLYVGPLDGLHNKKAVQIGKFPYSETNLDGATKWEITIPSPTGEDCVIAAHAVVQKVVDGAVQEETAWANCTFKPIITLKTKFVGPIGGVTDPTACTDGDYFYTDLPHDYCNYLGINYYVKGDVYQLQSAQFPLDPMTGEGVGQVMVTDDGDYLYVTVESTLMMYRSHLFVGTPQGLELIAKRGGENNDVCPKYDEFPYRVDKVSTTHVFPGIPIPPIMKSISFESFGSSRWGWYSYCN